jgi:hypothetical protein
MFYLQKVWGEEASSIQIETISKKSEAETLFQISSKGLGCDLCEQTHASGTCIPTSLGLSDEHVKYLGCIYKKSKEPIPE